NPMTTTSRPTEGAGGSGGDSGEIPLKPLESDAYYSQPKVRKEEATEKAKPAKKSFGARVRDSVSGVFNFVRGKGKKPTLAGLIQPAPWKIAEEPKWGRYVAMVLMTVGLILFTYVVAAYHSGAHGGVDQNGYHRTAQMIVDEHTTGWRQS